MRAHRILAAHAAALAVAVFALPAMADDMMAKPADATGAMSTNSMGAMDDSMNSANTMGGDAMGGHDMMMKHPKAIEIAIQDLTTGQPFSPSYFDSRGAAAAPLFQLGDKAPDALVSVAEGGNIGDFSVMAAKDAGKTFGEAALAIHTLPGQTRTLIIHVDKDHPLIDGVWMLGNTNDGFSGFTGFNAYDLRKPATLEVRGYDAGSEKNNEKKGYLGALGGGNMRDPENGVITYHTGIRGDADAPKKWNWDVSKPVAKITFTPVMETASN